MQSLSKKEFAYRAAIALTLAAAFFIVWRLGAVLMLAFGGVVLAVVIRLAADPIARVTHMEERWADLLVMMLIVAGLVLGGYFFGSEIADQFSRLRERLPQGLDRIREWTNSSSNQPSAGVPEAGQLLSGVVNAASTTFNVVVDLILVFLVAVYLSFSPGRYTRGLTAMVPPAHRADAKTVLAASNDALRGWLKGQLISMTAVGVLVWFGLWLVGVPLSFALGLIAGILEFVPILGPFVAAVPGILLAFTESPTMALYAGLVYLAVQQLETNIVTPLAQRWAVHLPPALGLVALAAFGSLFGLPGLLFAAPLTVVLMVLVRRLYLDRISD